MNTIRLLLIEDNPGDARLIREMLADARETRFEMAVVDHLRAGIGRLHEDEVNLVLLDLSLPDSTGIETFRGLQKTHPRVPVVVLTGLDDQEVGLKAVAEGAQDYLIKGEVDSRRLVHSLCYALGRCRRQARLENEFQSTREEIDVARHIQEQLFPKAAPACGGFDIHGVSHPAAAADGDYFDYVPLCDQTLGIVIGDVTGHGLGPAMIMAATRAYLRAFAQSHADPKRMLALVNRLLAADLDDGRNVTLMLGRLDPRTRSFTYASAGHPTGYLVSSSGAIKAELLSTGVPLGILPETDYGVSSPLQLGAGDVLFLYTDGLVDAWSPAARRFGWQRALDIVRARRDQPARAIIEALWQAMQNHVQDERQRDDVTMIVIKVA